ncbi:adenosylcobalamin-dependent ribonucleoside-diphosphate reductase [Pelagicoccus sp. SDUM812003]|uniref:adenosylcobalamin-dependent ribonucleoside-diphosphate reductase n=1 Tax=Pelagicoccus sp. SDUM812003 TaxID=3041267 RepID=UPI00280ED856|nr:adenosylcobalamin-dependent ribonucleoside-diphosphate reductase [Pelagicoccus sp. SDUM812003]MDQ8205534.1 adenosylcobalamin-dependent ribonucleoside-diphosphate reductase [Pelagicoccus sp. SDUM812003]
MKPLLEDSAETATDDISLDLGYGQTLQLEPRENLIGGMTIERRFTKDKRHPYETVEWVRRDVAIMDWKTGKPSFEREGVEVPEHWGDSAVKITASKYLFGNDPGTPQYEDSFRHAFDRIANTYTLWGWRHGYFATLDDALAYNHELKHLLVKQMWAPNSPVWFNIGHWEQWRWDRPDLRPCMKARGNRAYKAHIPTDGTSEDIKVSELDNAYIHPQASACFLLDVEDSMEKILEHQIAEGGVFSSGSGVGMNLSTIRSSVEPISGRGQASGPISFDKGYDRMAGAIKSGGKTRRAARMVLLFADHPDIFKFIRAKNDQEEIGKIVLREHNVSVALRGIASKFATSGTPAQRMAASIVLGMPLSNELTYGAGMDDLLYGETLAHQNANHSVSLKGDYWRALQSNGDYHTRWVSDPNHVADTFKAEKILDEIAECVWHNAEPGVHNNDFINLWNPVKSDGDILTSNPCSEYLHLSFTSCNLSSFNVYRFYDAETGRFDVEALRHAARLAMIAADLNVEEGGFPIPEIARGTYLYRTTGIGYANVGGLLMSIGVPYDSDEGRMIASQLVSLLTSACWKASAEMGKELGSYPRFEQTEEDLREVLSLHAATQELSNEIAKGCNDVLKAADAIYKKRNKELPQSQGLTGRDALRGFARSIENKSAESHPIVEQLLDENAKGWAEVLEAKRFRNSFTTVMAPTGTISAPMGVYEEGTTSAEPDYTLVKYKNLSGGGMLKMFNSLALKGLRSQGYSKAQVREAALEVAGIDGLFAACGSIDEAANHLQQNLFFEKGPIRKQLDDWLAETHDPENPSIEQRITTLRAKGQDGTANAEELVLLGGDNHMERIPWLKPEHLAAFDCSATTGDSTRSIRPLGHMRMLGAIQPFLSGATSKTLNLPHTATKADIKQSLVDCHEMGVKCVAIYRADSKGISVYNVNTPEARKWNPEYLWEALVESVRDEVQKVVVESSKPRRIKLPGRRISQTLKFTVGGNVMEGFLTVGVYPDGTCGEVFGKVNQSGSFANGMFESFCKAFSIALQYGVPLHSLIESFRYTAFEPSGFTQVGDAEGHADSIKTCKSVVDAMMQTLEWLFPASNGGKLQGLVGHEFTESKAPVASSGTNGASTVVSATTPPSKPAGEGNARSAESCPKCGSLAYVHDGKCRSCRDCGFKDGGCGE